jgi:hypothetical protein
LAQRLATAQALDSKDRKAYLRPLLCPARFCYSWISGRMGSNDDAMAFLRKTRLDMSLITRALECRWANADPDSLISRANVAAV